MDVEMAEPFIVNETEETVLENYHLQAVNIDTNNNVTIDDTRTYYLQEVPSHGFLMRDGVVLNTAGLNKTFKQKDINDGLMTYYSIGGNVTLDSFKFRFKIDTNTWTGDFTFPIQIFPTPKPPTISLLQNQMVPFGTESVSQNFSIGDPDTPLENLTLSVFSDNIVLVPLANIETDGEGANWSVMVTPVEGKSGIAKITVTVSDGELEASAFFELNVLPAPQSPTLEISYNTPTTNVNSFMIGESVAIPFFVEDPDTPINSVLVETISDNLLLAPPSAVSVTKFGNERLLIVEPPAQKRGKAVITLIATDGINDFSASTEVNITTQPPTIEEGLPGSVTLYQDTAQRYTLFLDDPDTPVALVNARVADNTNETYFTVSFSPGSEDDERIMTITRNTNALDQVIQGTFSVELSDEGGPFLPAGTVAYTLTTNSAAPTLPAIGNQTTPLNTPLTLSMTLSDPDTPYEYLRLLASSPDFSSNDFRVVNTGSSHQFTFQPPIGKTGSYPITLIAYDGRFYASNIFLLTVTELPADMIAKQKGYYEGLITDPIFTLHERSGFLSGRVSKKGKFTGKLNFGSQQQRIRGTFDAQGLLTGSFPQAPPSPQQIDTSGTVSYELALTASGQIVGYIWDGPFRSGISAYRRGITQGERAKLPSRYTAALSAKMIDYAVIFSSNYFAPRGFGYVTLAMNRKGMISIRGETPEGQKIRQRVGISPQFTIPFYQSTHKGGGSIGAELQLFAADASTAVLNASKTFYTAPGAGFASPFRGALQVRGGAYQSETLKLEMAEISLERNKDSELANLTRIRNVFRSPDEPPMELRLNAKTGQFKGYMIHPYTGKKAKIGGVILGTEYAAGLVHQENLGEFYTSGRIELKPAEEED